MLVSLSDTSFLKQKKKGGKVFFAFSIVNIKKKQYLCGQIGI